MEKMNRSQDESQEKREVRRDVGREVKREFKQRQEEPKFTLYKVQAGDSLSAIAKKFYDDAAKYMEIYEANKDLIGDDPNLIKVGMELKVPRK